MGSAASIARSLMRFRPVATDSPVMGLGGGQVMGPQGTLATYRPQFTPKAEAVEPPDPELLSETRPRTVMQDAPTMGMQQPSMMGLGQTPEEQSDRALWQRGPTQHRGGVMERIGDALIAMHEAQQGADPNERWMSLGAGGAGFVKPEISHNIKYQHELAQSGQRAKASRAPLDAERKRRLEHAQVFGYDDVMGMTEGRRHREATEQQTAFNQQGLVEDRNARNEDRDLARQDRAYQTWVEYGDANTPLSPVEAQRMGRPQLAGEKSPATKKTGTKPANVQVFESDAGLMERDPVTGAWKPAVGPQGTLKKKEKPNLEAVRLARQTARDAESDRRERQREERDAEKQYNSVRSNAVKADGALSKAQRDLTNAKEWKKQGKITEDQLPAYEEAVRQAEADSDNAWYEAQQAAKTLGDEHGWKVSVKDGRYPNAQKPPAKRAAAGGGGRNPVRRDASAADIEGFAKEYFGGDKAKAEAYLKQQGYTVR